MRLGLGLGLSKNNFIKSGGDPLLEALKSNSEWLLYSDQADGSIPGSNSPLTNPLKDIVGYNDATLTNFVGTVTSGYDQFLAPNGKTVTGLQPDFVDDFLKALDNYNPLGLSEFGLCFIIRAKSRQGFLLCKGPIATAQISVYHYVTSRIALRVGGSFVSSGSGAVPSKDTFYKIFAYRHNGNLIIEVNDTEVYNSPNTRNLTSQANTALMAANSDATGLTQESYTDSALFMMSAAPIDGDITSWMNAVNSFASDKYGL